MYFLKTGNITELWLKTCCLRRRLSCELRFTRVQHHYHERWKLQAFVVKKPATENKKGFFQSQDASENFNNNSAAWFFAPISFVLLRQLCSEFWTMQPTPPTVCDSLMGSDLSTMELLLGRPLKGGEIWWGGQKLICVDYLRCSVLYGTDEPFTTGKSIHHTVPLLTDP